MPEGWGHTTDTKLEVGQAYRKADGGRLYTVGKNHLVNQPHGGDMGVREDCGKIVDWRTWNACDNEILEPFLGPAR